jgi:uncharacterized cupin superfamily protein
MSAGDLFSCVAHWTAIEGGDDNHYPGSDEMLTISASYSNTFKLMRLDGHVRQLKPGDGVSFPAGTGLAHTFMNNTGSDVRFLVVGEASRQRSRIHYPLHPERNAEIGERHWKEAEGRPLGPHDCIPDRAR